MMRALLPLALLATGCTPSGPGVGSTLPPDQLLDFNGFVCNVQPVLIRRCSYLGCHGQADHALRVYSAGKLRLAAGGNRNARDLTLTADEIELNFQSAVGMVYAATAEERKQPAIDKIPLLQKPLAAREGGSEHHGIDIFPQFPALSLANDPEWKALVDWVGGKKATMPLSQDCQDMFSGLGIQPRSM